MDQDYDALLPFLFTGGRNDPGLWTESRGGSMTICVHSCVCGRGVEVGGRRTVALAKQRGQARALNQDYDALLPFHFTGGHNDPGDFEGGGE